MICLACEFESTSFERCELCGADFSVRPPFVSVNHLSQLLVALDAFKTGTLDRAGFLRRLDVFVQLFVDIGNRWDFSVNFADRLGPALSASLIEPLEVLDAAVGLLDAALQELEPIRQSTRPDVWPAEVARLERAEDAFIDFFRATCSACADLLAVVEDSPDLRRSGLLIDISLG